MQTNPIIGFVGTTHLAIVSSVAAAARGFEVVCFGDDPNVVERLQAGEFPVHEPGLKVKAAETLGNLHFTTDVRALARVDVCFVADDIPTDAEGRSNLDPVRGLISVVEPVLPAGAVLVILCQVPPGFTRAVARTERDVVYQVETLVFGESVQRAMSPERFIVGCADAAEDLPGTYSRYLAAFGCPVLKMSYESAELAKIAINLFLVSSVSTTNALAEICEKLGADWSEIVPALRLDRRIGEYAYLSPGLGIGGGNLERDVATIVSLANELEIDVGLMKVWQTNSQRRRRWVQEVIGPILRRKGGAARVGLLGLTYKQDTASTRNSAALTLLRDLPQSCVVKAYDPVVKVNSEWHVGIVQAANMFDACKDSDILIIMTPWAEFRELAPAKAARLLSGRLVVDPYRMLDAGECVANGLEVVSLGRKPQ